MTKTKWKKAKVATYYWRKALTSQYIRVLSNLGKYRKSWMKPLRARGSRYSLWNGAWWCWTTGNGECISQLTFLRTEPATKASTCRRNETAAGYKTGNLAKSMEANGTMTKHRDMEEWWTPKAISTRACGLPTKPMALECWPDTTAPNTKENSETIWNADTAPSNGEMAQFTMVSIITI